MVVLYILLGLSVIFGIYMGVSILNIYLKNKYNGVGVFAPQYLIPGILLYIAHFLREHFDKNGGDMLNVHILFGLGIFLIVIFTALRIKNTSWVAGILTTPFNLIIFAFAAPIAILVWSPLFIISYFGSYSNTVRVVNK